MTISTYSLSGAKSGPAVSDPLYVPRAPKPPDDEVFEAEAPIPYADAERRWSCDDSMFWSAAPTSNTLPPGLYRATYSERNGPMLQKVRCDTDDLLQLPDSVAESVLSEIKEFHKLEARFIERGFLHKRGVLLWGPPGSGKTATVQLLIKLMIDDLGGIAIFIDHPGVASSCLQMVRRIEPKRPILCIMEDMDALIVRYAESEYLALLDGESQVNNIVFVATSNYPEMLDRRFKDRPSRFDSVKQIGMPSNEARRAYLLAKEPSLANNNEVDSWVANSAGFSVAHLREMIILCKCFGYSLSEATDKLETMRRDPPNSGKADDGLSGTVGFVREQDKSLRAVA